MCVCRGSCVCAGGSCVCVGVGWGILVSSAFGHNFRTIFCKQLSQIAEPSHLDIALCI